MPTPFLYKKHNYFISNSFYLYISNFADYMIMLIFIPFIARKIGAVEFGKIGVFQTFSILLIVIIEFGSSLIATREVSRLENNHQKLKKFISNYFSF